MKKDHQVLGDLYCEQVLNEGPLRSAAIGAAALASGFLGGNNAKADDSAVKSPMIQHAQAVSQQHAQAVSQTKSILKNVQGLKQLALQIKQDRNVVNKAPFIKTLCQLYGIKDDGYVLFDAIMKDVNTYDKKIEDSELCCPEEEVVMDYLSHHDNGLQNYINNVLDPRGQAEEEMRYRQLPR